MDSTRAIMEMMEQRPQRVWYAGAAIQSLDWQCCWAVIGDLILRRRKRRESQRADFSRPGQLVTSTLRSPSRFTRAPAAFESTDRDP